MTRRQLPASIIKENGINNAVAAVKEKKQKDLAKAADAFNVPRSTTYSRAKGQLSRRKSHQRQQALTVEEEDELVKQISMEITATGRFPQHKTIKDWAEQTRQRSLNECNLDKSGGSYQLLGRDWVRRFLSRHSHLLEHKYAQLPRHQLPFQDGLTTARQTKSSRLSLFKLKLERLARQNPNHPNCDYFRPIFDFLAGLYTSRKLPDKTVTVPETILSNIIYDLLEKQIGESSGVQSFPLSEKNGQLKQPLDSIIASYFQLLAKPETDIPTSSVWSIPTNNGDGLSSWADSIASKLIDNFSLELRSEFSTTVSPSGYISNWHFDQLDAGTLLVELSGDNLFICFPPTPHNLKIFPCNQHILKISKSIEILKQLEDVYFFTLGPGDVRVLEPGHGHMVVSAGLAAVGGWSCYKEDWKEEIQRIGCECRGKNLQE